MRNGLFCLLLGVAGGMAILCRHSASSILGVKVEKPLFLAPAGRGCFVHKVAFKQHSTPRILQFKIPAVSDAMHFCKAKSWGDLARIRRDAWSGLRMISGWTDLHIQLCPGISGN